MSEHIGGLVSLFMLASIAVWRIYEWGHRNACPKCSAAKARWKALKKECKEAKRTMAGRACEDRLYDAVRETR
jgi:hypothetical protein